MTYLVFKMPNSRTWGIYEVSTGYSVGRRLDVLIREHGRLVEGGFFSKAAALEAAAEWKAGTR